MAKAKAPRSTTIALVNGPGEPARKITKIVNYKDGGFAVLAPYHSARSGYLAKHRVDYRKSRDKAHRSEMTEFSASDRVKLSFHPDGFVQFSGENPKKIISGRDPETGEPRGLGILLEHPLYQPIRSGPTFGMVVWGLSDYEPLNAREEASALVVREDDYYYRHSSPSTWNGYVLEFFILPRRYLLAARSRAERLTLSVAFGHFEAGSGVVLDLLLIPLGNQPILLGLMCSRLRHNFPGSGFNLSSPSNRRNEEPIAEALLASYPNLWPDPPKSSLDYTSASAQQMRIDE